MTDDLPEVRPETRQIAIEATRRHILRIKQGRLVFRDGRGKRIPIEADYVKAEHRRLNQIIGEVSE